MKTSLCLLMGLFALGAGQAASAARPCGDGRPAVCEIIPASCPAGQVREIRNGCFGECVDAETCEPVAAPRWCGDGTVPVCEVMPASCPTGQVREVVNGCFGECVDAATCGPVEAPPCLPVCPAPPEGCAYQGPITCDPYPSCGELVCG